jgi:hypothetical protein
MNSLARRESVDPFTTSDLQALHKKPLNSPKQSVFCGFCAFGGEF